MCRAASNPTTQFVWVSLPNRKERVMPEHAVNSAAQSTGTETETGELSTDQVFMLLKNERRRRTLSILADEEETTLSDLAEQIAAMEHDTTPDALSSSERKRVYVSLYQCHLPKLAECGVIEFDSSRGDVSRRPKAATLEAYLDNEASDDVTRGVPAVGGIVAVVSLVGVLAAPALGPATLWGGVAGGVLLAVSAYLGVGSLSA